MTPPDISSRLARLDWDAIESSLWQQGYARTPPLLAPDECERLSSLYVDEQHFRSRVDMARHQFGEGEYKYFRYPLPSSVEQLRSAAFPYLAQVANRWAVAMGQSEAYPVDHGDFLNHCHQHGQTKPTPLLLHYGAGGYNCLHQDIYGAIVFPIQLAVFLSRPGEDYTGGEFLLVEQRPRAQSRGLVVTPAQGEAVIFTTRDRPAAGRRGYVRRTVRHGVSTVHSGKRFTLGVIFHDAQ